MPGYPLWWPAPIRRAHLALAARALGAASHAALWDRGLVAEVGAAAPRRSPVHTVHLSAGGILQTRRGRPRLHLERKTGRADAERWRTWRGSQKCVHRAPWSRPTELFSSPNPLHQLPAYIRTCCGAAGLRTPAAGWEAVATAPGASPRRWLQRPAVSPGCVPVPLARHPPFKCTLGPTLRPSRI